MIDWGFIKAVIVSPTFTELLWSVILKLLVVLFIGALLIVARRKYRVYRSGSLHQNVEGSANAADFVLVFPVFAFMMCVFVQMAMVVNASLIVHYAAYSAARTARVHYCDRTALEYPLGFAAGCNINRARREAIKAARFVLISASPVDASIPSNGNPPTQMLEWVSSQYLKRDAPLVVQARYAYDSRNTIVRVREAVSTNPLVQAQLLKERLPAFNSSSDPNTFTDKKLLNAWPVTVSVEYIKHLGVPLAGPLLSDVQRGNNHFRRLDAEITLL